MYDSKVDRLQSETMICCWVVGFDCGSIVMSATTEIKAQQFMLHETCASYAIIYPYVPICTTRHM